MRRRQGGAPEPVLRAISELGWDPAGLVVADSFVARLFGMTVHAPYRSAGVPVIMYLPRTRSVHTCFMRYALDVAFADCTGHVIRLHRKVASWRMVSCCTAAFTLERATAIEEAATGFPKKKKTGLTGFQVSVY